MLETETKEIPMIRLFLILSILTITKFHALSDNVTERAFDSLIEGVVIDDQFKNTTQMPADRGSVEGHFMEKLGVSQEDFWVVESETVVHLTQAMTDGLRLKDIIRSQERKKVRANLMSINLLEWIEEYDPNGSTFTDLQSEMNQLRAVHLLLRPHAIPGFLIGLEYVQGEVEVSGNLYLRRYRNPISGKTKIVRLFDLFKIAGQDV